MKVGALPPFLDGGVTNEHLGNGIPFKPPEDFEGVTCAGGENERNEVARGIEDGDVEALLNGRELSE